MDYWRSPGVKEVKALQDLPTPAPQDLGFHHFKALQVTVQREQKQDFVVTFKKYCNQPVMDSYIITTRDIFFPIKISENSVLL